MIYKNKVIKVAVVSRLLVFLLQYIFNHLIEDHDPDVFRYSTDARSSQYDKIVWHLLGGFLRWDGQYFMHIAKNGYTYENSMAFLPLFPMIIRIIADFIGLFVTFLNRDSLLLLTFTLFNSVVFVRTSVILYELTEIILYPTIAFKAAVLFSFNPASVFFSAPYSETLFAYLTFKGILNCLKFYGKYSDKNAHGRLTDITYILPFSLSTCTRSNGLLNIGFFFYTLGCLFLHNYPLGILRQLIFIVKYVAVFLVYTCIGILPFALYQQFCYNMFCKTFDAELPVYILNYSMENGFILPGETHKHNQTWCNNSIPLAYSYVQNHYWDVGFLKYYEIKQIPNFLLALPILSIVFCNCLIFFKNNRSFNVFTFDRIYDKRKMYNIFKEPSICVFALHAFAFSLFCMFCIHVQVSTRMICSSTPFFYWICAHYLKNINFSKRIIKESLVGSYNTCIEKLIRLYFVLYFILGTALFCNYLPFT